MQEHPQDNFKLRQVKLQLTNNKLLDTLGFAFQSLFDLSDDNVHITDHLGRLVYMNPTTLKTIGRTQDEVLGYKGIDILPNDTAMQRYFDAVKKVITTQQATTILLVKENNHPGRSLYDVITITPIVNQQNKLIGTLSIGRESTHEKYLEDKEIKQREHYQRALLDNFPFIVWLKDKEGRFLAANAAFARVAGVSSTKELEGKTDFDFFPAELARGYVAQDLQVLKSNEPLSTVEKIKIAHGDEYLAETYKSPVSINGQVIGTVGFSHDITERIQLLSEISNKDSAYSSLAKNLPLAIFRYDLNCRRTFISGSDQSLDDPDLKHRWGKSPAESWNPHIKSITGAEYQALLLEVMNTGQVKRIEITSKLGGNEHVSLATIAPEFNGQKEIVGALTISSDITEITQYRKQLEQLAYQDSLTLLPNREFFYQQLNIAIEHAKKNHTQFGVMFLDMDYFKAINDTLGHFAGDQLLVQASKRILSCVKGKNLLARIGGDEFAVLVANANKEDLAALAADIASTLEAPFEIEHASFFITVSIGISTFPKDSSDIDGLMKYADTAMYQAKKKGRNNFQFHSKQLNSLITERLVVETALRYALEKNELSLHFQPKVDVLTGNILGAEALLRWDNPEIAKLEPAQFIPITEESGLIVEIGAWVLMQGCIAAVKLNKDHALSNLHPIVIAMNLSSRQFLRHNLLATLRHCLKTTGCLPEWIALEITESLLLQDSIDVMLTLTKINQMGITLAIDDFGTGFSALAYLNKFPIQQVKIDRSFIRDICTNEKAALLVKAIIAMGQSLSMELVAEGIENRAQSAMLARFGCYQAQGYLYGKPTPFEDFLKLLH
ncbi:MAG TPA: EAL domain-containing protein [Methylophilaceae bacterium]|jgi:diguanylate cyclase (GGDEF)-like protein/PAS domain S-box-containing protein